MIYVVTSGEYSDYGIDAMFDDKELAQDFIDSFNPSYDEMRIEEYELNPYGQEIRKGCKPYFIRMTREGSAHGIHTEDSAYGFDGIGTVGYDAHGDMYIYVFAKDEKHATKICNEKRTQIIANNKWGER